MPSLRRTRRSMSTWPAATRRTPTPAATTRALHVAHVAAAAQPIPNHQIRKYDERPRIRRMSRTLLPIPVTLRPRRERRRPTETELKDRPIVLKYVTEARSLGKGNTRNMSQYRQAYVTTKASATTT